MRNLSGGNLQKLVLGREFEGEPRVSHRRAADPGPRHRRASRRSIHTSVRRRERGVAILLISEDLDELRALADRILVMYEGAAAGELQGPTATVEQLGFLMAGGRSED